MTLLSNSYHITKQYEQKLEYCRIASQIYLKYGPKKFWKEEYISEFWDYKKNLSSPSIEPLKHSISIANIRWFIYNYVEFKDNIWNSDFIRGVATGGTLVERQDFPCIKWYDNNSIIKLLKLAPFYVGLYKIKRAHFWSNIVAFCSKYSEDTLSFMAGVLATGNKITINKKVYIFYSHSAVDYIRKWCIPEETCDIKAIKIARRCLKLPDKYCLISPFWTALLSFKMPEMFKKRWIVYNAINAKIYALLMYKLYVNRSIKSRLLPYLIGRTTLFKNRKKLEDIPGLCIKYKIVSVDNIVKNAAKEYANWYNNKEVKNDVNS